ncbi:hypothetical protein BASA50_000978 [Batrachochytrium salamandrivorans]|uniref:non-specific serine/threonine protein kinase n=1 Tax=Batrachochytrium salamandrivorans TaxID=1357716 RepID=A0ABQ8ESN7_9FUNG|nr:hypothetical protein BASA50_000978 [Batrachochytrium salamandrivorans]
MRFKPSRKTTATNGRTHLAAPILETTQALESDAISGSDAGVSIAVVPKGARQSRVSKDRSSCISRICALTDRLLNTEQLDASAYSRRIGIARQLLKFLLTCPLTVDVQPAISALVNGGRGLQPLDVVFDEHDAPVAFKTAVVECLAAAITAIRGNPAIFFRWMFDRIRSLDRTTSSRIWLLVALKEIMAPRTERIECYGFGNTIILDIITNIVKLMSTMETPDLLPAMIDVLDVISEEYPDIFMSEFTNIMDILIAWSVSEIMSESFSSIIFTTISRYWPFWIHYIPFGMSHIHHLTSNIDQALAVLWNPQSIGSEIQNPEMILAEFQCVYALLDALFLSSFQSINPDLGTLIPSENEHTEDIFHTTKHALYLTQALHDVLQDSQLNTISMNIITLVSRCTEPCLSSLQVGCLDLILFLGGRYLGNFPEVPPKNEFFEWIDRTTEVLSTSIEQTHNESLIEMCLFPSKSTVFTNIRISCMETPAEMDRLSAFFLLILQRLPMQSKPGNSWTISEPGELLTEAMHIMKHMIHDFNACLVENDKSASVINIPADILTCPSAKPLFIADLDFQALRRVFELDILICDASVNAGCSSYGAPTTFVWLYDIWKLASSNSNFCGQTWWFNIELSLILSMANLSEECNFFLPALLVSPTELRSTRSWEMIRRLFQGIREIFDVNIYDRQLVAMHMIHSIISEIKDKNKLDTDVSQSGTLQLVEELLIHLLDSAATQPDASIRIAIANLWEAYLEPFFLNRRGSMNTIVILSKFTSRLDDIHKDVRDTYWRVVSLFDPIDSQMCLTAKERMPHLAGDFIQLFKHAVMVSPAFGTFRPRHFQLVMAHMGLGQCFRGGDEDLLAEVGLGVDSNEWLVRMFYASQALQLLRANSKPPSDDVFKAAVISQESLIFWALWESARFCVLSRLRTPLGGPIQTLEGFDRTLHYYQDMIREMQNSELINIGYSQFFSVTRRLRHFLEFIDVLEIQIFNAARGNFCLLPLVPKSSMVFMHANRRVCEEWYVRIRLILVDLSSTIESDGITIRHAYKALQDRIGYMNTRPVKELPTWEKDCAFLLVALCQALRRSKDSDSLVGLAQYWRRETLTMRPSIPLASENIYRWICVQAILAQGQYEVALTELQRLSEAFTDTEKSVLNVNIQEQVLECYSELGDWSATQRFLQAQSGKDPIIDKELITDEIFSSVDGFPTQAWDLSECTSLADDQIIRSFLSRGPSVLTRKVYLDMVMHTFSESADSKQFLLQSAAINQPLFQTFTSNGSDHAFAHLVFSQILSRIAVVDRTVDTAGTVRIGGARTKYRIHEEGLVAKDLGSWIQLHSLLKENESYQRTRKRDPDLDEIRGLLANLSRKARNFRLANRLLDSSQSNLTSSAALQNNFKFARLLYEEGRSRDALFLLLNVINTQSTVLDPSNLEIKAKSCKLISEWNRLVRLDMNDPQVKRHLDLAIQHSVDPIPLSITQNWLSYNLLKRATEISPAYPKSWFAFGTFCYRVGRRALDSLTTRETSSDLIQEDLEKLSNYLESIGHLDLTDLVISTLLGDFGESLRDLNQQDWRETIRCIGDDSDSHIAVIEDILEAIRRKTFKYFDTATSSYFKYLLVHHHAKIDRAESGRPEVPDPKKESKRLGDTITTTLRLIRLFTKYGAALYQTFLQGFSSTPSTQWEAVIPQLFSRLHHPEPIVRQEIGNLLCHIGSISPHLIMYPVIIGSKPETQRSDLAQMGYSKLFASLHNSNSTLVDLVSTWIAELQKITVLWEELWLHGLEHVQNEVQGRVERLVADIGRIKSNKTLSSVSRVEVMRRNATSVMRPILFSIEKLYEQTVAKGATTRHEQIFIEQFGEVVEQSLCELRETAKYEEPQILLDSFRQIHSQLHKYVRRSQTLRLADVSPYLSTISNSLISVPGLMDEHGMLTVAGCEEELLILPTKTKPKKITLRASNGLTYSYLLKGMEDLHLDQRIQQFIVTVNHLLKGDSQTRARDLSARNFAVIPLGDNFGMIRWIEGATGLFSIFRKWQQREHAALVLQRKEGAPDIPPPVRPHDAFAAKASKALASRGVKGGPSRKNWPTGMLKEIFTELKRETPNNLISMELWSSSNSSLTWWKKTKTFSRSAAVMSIVGYVIGLGDRHLDNILIDVEHGEVAHIDFNVCFEKGRNLRIPETVPFRLTQNIVGALGPNDIEGTFRIACEQVFRVMRENREILLTLLEAFIYDPLVDWTHNTRSQHEKSLMNLNAQIGILSSRIIEFKAPLLENSQKLDSFLVMLGKKAAHTASMITQHSQLIESIKVLEHDMDTCEESYDIPQTISDDVSKAKTLLIDLQCQYSEWHNTHMQSITTVLSLVDQADAELATLEGLSTDQHLYTPSVVLPLSKSQSTTHQLLNDAFLVHTNEVFALHTTVLKTLRSYDALVGTHSKALVKQDTALDWSLLLQASIHRGLDPDVCNEISAYQPSFDYSRAKSTSILAVMMSSSLDSQRQWLQSLLAYCDEPNPAVQKDLIAENMTTLLMGCDNPNALYLLRAVTALLLTEAVCVLSGSSNGQLLFSIADELATLKEKLGAILLAMPLSSGKMDIVLTIPAIECIIRLIQDTSESQGLEQILPDCPDLSSLSCIVRATASIWQVLSDAVGSFVKLVLRAMILGVDDIALITKWVSQLSNLSDGDGISNSSDRPPCDTKMDPLNELLSTFEDEAASHGGIANDCFHQIKQLLHQFREILYEITTDPTERQLQSDATHVQIISLLSTAMHCAISHLGNSQLSADDPTAESLDIDWITDTIRESSDFEPYLSKLHDLTLYICKEVIAKSTSTLLCRIISEILVDLHVSGDDHHEVVSHFSHPTGIHDVDAVRKAVNLAISAHVVEVDHIQELAVLVLRLGFGDVRWSLVEWVREVSGKRAAQLESAEQAFERFKFFHARSLENVEGLSLEFQRTTIMEQLKTVVSQLTVEKSATGLVRLQIMDHDQSIIALPDGWDSSQPGALTLQEFAEQSQNRGRFLERLQAQQTLLSTLCDDLVHFESFRIPSTLSERTEAVVRQAALHMSGLLSTVESINDIGYFESQLQASRKKRDSLKIHVEQETLCDLGVDLVAQFDILQKDLDPIFRVMSHILKIADATPQAASLVTKIKEFNETWSLLKNKSQHFMSTCSVDTTNVAHLGEMETMARDLRLDSSPFFDTLFSLVELPEYSTDANGLEAQTITNVDQYHIVGDTREGVMAEMDVASLEIQMTSLAVDAETGETARMSQESSDEHTDLLAGDQQQQQQLGMFRFNREQTRNAHAVSVLKKIRSKLEGRDSDSRGRLSVPEHVDRIIREATNADNLAVMYEGWMSWI